LSVVVADSPPITQVAEHALYEDLEQGAQSVTYYSVTITRDYYEAGKQLVFRVIADSFGSDPDIYISRYEEYPNSAGNAMWYCEKKGSEVCIIEDGGFAVTDTLNFGITCLTVCKYKLIVQYAAVLDLGDTEREQIRFDAYSTVIASLYIPPTVRGLHTESLEVRLEAEQQYHTMDLWMSIDENLQVIEEIPA
jgi:hypothetical protein